MGISTALVGILPTFTQIGILAPVILVLLRLAQGLALGGEYGGAAIYVAEHSPDDKRGQNTSWIQTTATIGLLLALVVIGITRGAMSADDFTNFGWRIPFILSIILVAMAPVHPAAPPGDAAVHPAQGAGQVVHLAVAGELR
jgi:MFS family permease